MDSEKFNTINDWTELILDLCFQYREGATDEEKKILEKIEDKLFDIQDIIEETGKFGR